MSNAGRAGHGSPNPVSAIAARVAQSLARQQSQAVTKREIAWAMTLSLVLLAGIIGILLLQTSMDSQARSIQQQKLQAQSLATASQQVQRGVAAASDPLRLARAARRLHMHPQVTPRFLHPGEPHSAAKRRKLRHRAHVRARRQSAETALRRQT